MEETKPLRVAFAGDSITWVDGMLCDGFVGRADLFLRHEFATTIMHDRMLRLGKAELVSSPKLLCGSASKLSGIGSRVSFDMTSDGLTIVQAKERTNRSAAWVDLYVDGSRYDTFSNWNGVPIGEEAIRFVCDGRAVAFDLKRPFTYGHEVALDGAPLNGALLTTGYASAFPSGQDYCVIRKYAGGEDNNPEVHHYLWLASPPPLGSVLDVRFRYGETVAYAKGTVGETGEGIESPLESRYGDDNPDDVHAIGPISFGLDFRESDHRAAVSWRFPHAKKRSFELRIRGFDPRGGCQGDPSAIINFATDRNHAILNAGIGGKSARWFNGSDPLRSIRPVLEWKPDILVLGLGTNDDWEPGNRFVAWRLLHKVSEKEVRSRSVLSWKSCERNDDGSFRIETAELRISSVNERSVSIDHSDATFEDVKTGDLLVIGDYFGDNRNIQCRILSGWDPATRTGTFEKPLRPTAVTASLEAYSGQSVRIKRVDGFMAQMTKLIETVKTVAPDCSIALLETGLSHFETRLLMGYPEIVGQLARLAEAFPIPIYESLLEWQYSRKTDLQVRLAVEKPESDDGNPRVYRLTDEGGKDIQAKCGMQLRHWSVRVNGTERYGRGCRIEGGFSLAFSENAQAEGMRIADWQVRRNKQVVYRFLPTKLIFIEDPPPAAAAIEVNVASAKWSKDDAHLNLSAGVELYAAIVNPALECIIRNRLK